MYFFNKVSLEHRFNFENFVEYNVEFETFDVLNSYFLDKVINLPIAGTYTVLTEEHRPDLVSFNLFNDTQFWYLLLIYNNKTSFLDLMQGDVLNYFSIGDLDMLYYNLKSNEIYNRSDI